MVEQKLLRRFDLGGVAAIPTLEFARKISIEGVERKTTCVVTKKNKSIGPKVQK